MTNLEVTGNQSRKGRLLGIVGLAVGSTGRSLLYDGYAQASEGLWLPCGCERLSFIYSPLHMCRADHLVSVIGALSRKLGWFEEQQLMKSRACDSRASLPAREYFQSKKAVKPPAFRPEGEVC